MYCGSDAALWVCTHAFTPNHECVYAICSACKYGDESKDKNKIKKRRKRKDADSTIITDNCNNPRSQNHKLHNLESFCDDKYLTDTYLTIMVRKRQKVPQFCSGCKKTICNKKQTQKKI